MGRVLEGGASILKWETVGQKYVGRYTGTKKTWERDVEETENQKGHKKGDVIGFLFEGADGNFTIIGASHSIESTMEQVKKDDVVSFEYLGKGKSPKGQVNKFRIELLDDAEADEAGFESAESPETSEDETPEE